jgi:hypothetical protein
MLREEAIKAGLGCVEPAEKTKKPVPSFPLGSLDGMTEYGMPFLKGEPTAKMLSGVKSFVGLPFKPSVIKEPWKAKQKFSTSVPRDVVGFKNGVLTGFWLDGSPPYDRVRARKATVEDVLTEAWKIWWEPVLQPLGVSFQVTSRAIPFRITGFWSAKFVGTIPRWTSTRADGSGLLLPEVPGAEYVVKFKPKAFQEPFYDVNRLIQKVGDHVKTMFSEPYNMAAGTITLTI